MCKVNTILAKIIRKVLELNGRTEILSFFGVILLFQPHPCFSLLFWLLFYGVCTSFVS